MDHVADLPEVQRGESDSGALPSRPEPRRLEPGDLHELKIDSLSKIGVLLASYNALNVPKEESLHFMEHLTQRRDAWFIEAGEVGLLYLTDVRPGWNANFHVIFWDGSLGPDRVAAAKTFVTDAILRFKLVRLTATVAQSNGYLKQFLQRVGFILEGVTRKGWSVDPPMDAIHYGMLEEEKPWPVLPLGGK